MQLLSQEIKELTYSNIVDEYLEWSPTTTYILETSTLSNSSMCKYGNYYYRSVINGNLNYRPDLNPTKWLKYDVSNRDALLDLRALSMSKVTGADLVVEFERGLITTLVLGYFEASVIKIEHLDSLGVVIPSLTQEIEYGANDLVYDYWDYIYSEYTIAVQRTLKVLIPNLGVKIRVTFEKSVNNVASCGYLIGGQPINMGSTSYGVGFNFTSYATKELDSFGTLTITKNNVQELVDFETEIYTYELAQLKRKIKEVYNDYVVFILDEENYSNNDNLITFGVIQDSSIVLSNEKLSIITWSVMESI